MNELIISSAFDLSEVARLTYENESEVFNKLSMAHELHEDHQSELSKSKRIEIFNNLKDFIHVYEDELSTLIAKEGGKPLKDAIVEVKRAAEGVDVAISELRNLKGQVIPMDLSPASKGKHAYTIKEPIGVVLAISAFNHPLNLIIHQVIPALAAGCPVLVKPALTTPLSCKRLVELLYKSGLPKQWCQMIICEDQVAEKLVSDSRVKFLTFIGSAKVGWYLRSKLAPGAKCSLEHGGAAPVIVTESADLEMVVPKVLKAGFYHAGQVCVSAQKVFVHESVMDRFKTMMISGMDELVTGDPSLDDTDVGPLILPRELQRVSSWVKEAIEEGAQVLYGAEEFSDTCYAPTLLLNPSEKSKVSTKEIFGPVVCLYSYSELDNAIDRANELDFCFQSAIFTNNMDEAFKATSRLCAKAVMVNEHTAFRVDWMPFGGAKNSGLGVGGIGPAMEDMSHEKLVVFSEN